MIPLEELFYGPKKTVLKEGEILIRLELPPMKPYSGGEYIKFGRRKAMEIAMIGVAALLTVQPPAQSEENLCVDAKLALATAAPTPFRARGAEKALTGKVIDDGLIMEAASIAAGECSPRTSWRTTKEYREDIIPALTRRAIRGALEKIVS
jgi:CO/xanthine dehydrogenase FAD-binding subunit